jgi:hypothetical protein
VSARCDIYSSKCFLLFLALGYVFGGLCWAKTSLGGECPDGYGEEIKFGFCQAESREVYCTAHYNSAAGICVADPDYFPSTPRCDSNGCYTESVQWGGFYLTPTKPGYDRTHMTATCNSEQEKSWGLCLNKCPAGTKSVGPLCAESCSQITSENGKPYINCGLGCAKDLITCVLTTADEVLAVVSLGMKMSESMAGEAVPSAAEINSIRSQAEVVLEALDEMVTVADTVVEDIDAVGKMSARELLLQSSEGIKLAIPLVNVDALAVQELAQNLMTMADWIADAAPRMGSVPNAFIQEYWSLAAGYVRDSANTLLTSYEKAIAVGKQAIHRIDTLAQIQETYDLLTPIVENEGITAAEIVDIASAVAAAAGPFTGGAGAAISVGLAYTYPACGTDLFRNWNNEVGKWGAFDDVLENGCTADTVSSTYNCESSPKTQELCRTLGLSTPAFALNRLTHNPSRAPTIKPTAKPSLRPTRAPTSPTVVPSRSPTRPTAVPSRVPTSPTVVPSTRSPSTAPTKQTAYPTVTHSPTVSPSAKRFTGGISCSDPNMFFGVKYYGFEILMMKTLDDGGDREEYDIAPLGSIALASKGWVLDGDRQTTVEYCDISRLSLTNLNDPPGDCNPEVLKDDPNGFYSCKICSSSFTTGKGSPNWYFVVPTTTLPSKIQFDVKTFEVDDNYSHDSGSDINWEMTYENPDGVDDLPGNTDVWRYFTRTSTDGRKQRLRYKQRRMCFSRTAFSDTYCIVK